MKQCIAWPKMNSSEEPACASKKTNASMCNQTRMAVRQAPKKASHFLLSFGLIRLYGLGFALLGISDFRRLCGF